MRSSPITAWRGLPGLLERCILRSVAGWLAHVLSSIVPPSILLKTIIGIGNDLVARAAHPDNGGRCDRNYGRAPSL
jgi:hypothetical protein